MVLRRAANSPRAAPTMLSAGPTASGGLRDAGELLPKIVNCAGMAPETERKKQQKRVHTTPQNRLRRQRRFRPPAHVLKGRKIRKPVHRDSSAHRVTPHTDTSRGSPRIPQGVAEVERHGSAVAVDTARRRPTPAVAASRPIFSGGTGTGTGAAAAASRGVLAVRSVG